MQVLLAQVQNSEQLLRTLQGTVSQAQERVQLQMVRAGGPGPGGGGRRGVGGELVEAHVEGRDTCPTALPNPDLLWLRPGVGARQIKGLPGTEFRQSPPHTQLRDL